MESSVIQRKLKVWIEPGFQVVLIWFLIARILTAGIAILISKDYQLDKSVTMLRAMPVEAELITSPAPVSDLLHGWYRWDTVWYINIAANGYASNANSIIFPPFYSFLIRLFVPFAGGDYLLSSLIISNVAFILMLYLFYLLVAREYGEEFARQSIPLYVCYPTAFFFVAGYTESLFMVLVLGSWLLTLNRHYWWAALTLFLATLTRTQGWAVGIPLFYIAYVEQGNWREDWKYPRRIAPKLVLAGSSLLAIVVYMGGMELSGLGSVGKTFGNLFWEDPFAPPWNTLIRLVSGDFLIEQSNTPEIQLNLLTLVFISVMGALATRYLRPAYWMYIWLTLLTIFMRNHPTALHGLSRYVISLFPLFIMLGLVLDKQRFARLAYVFIGLIIQLLLVAVFVVWGFVG
jgi:hypothetical protein